MRYHLHHLIFLVINHMEEDFHLSRLYTFMCVYCIVVTKKLPSKFDIDQSYTLGSIHIRTKIQKCLFNHNVINGNRYQRCSRSENLGDIELVKKALTRAVKSTFLGIVDFNFLFCY